MVSPPLVSHTPKLKKLVFEREIFLIFSKNNLRRHVYLKNNKNINIPVLFNALYAHNLNVVGSYINYIVH